MRLVSPEKYSFVQKELDKMRAQVTTLANDKESLKRELESQTNYLNKYRMETQHLTDEIRQKQTKLEMAERYSTNIVTYQHN